jgi:RNA polymerase sigma-70 factor (ECF subfamily)
LLADRELIERIARRDQQALLQLYRKYGDLVYSFALRVVGESGLAEEIAQDIFLKIWRQPARWDPALGQFSSWLLAITRNAAIDRLRAEQRRPGFRAAELDPSMASPRPPAAGDPNWFDGQLLRRLLGELPAEQRTLIELAFFMGYTHSELADQLQLPLGTVKTRIRTGLQKLRTLWRAAGGG